VVIDIGDGIRISPFQKFSGLSKIPPSPLGQTNRRIAEEDPLEWGFNVVSHADGWNSNRIPRMVSHGCDKYNFLQAKYRLIYLRPKHPTISPIIDRSTP
jgi:hypothetical protein